MFFSILFPPRRNTGILGVPIWEEFLRSREYRVILTMTMESWSTRGTNADLPHKNAVKVWIGGVVLVCKVWTEFVYHNLDFFDNEDRYVDEGKDVNDLEERILNEDELQVWKTVCFLVKGAFYLINRIPLKALDEETSDQFLLHAAVEVLPLCQMNSANCRLVWDRILQLHGDQVVQEGPVLRRFPLHIAAATPSRANPIGRTSLVNPPKTANELQRSIFNAIMDKSPTSVATFKDAQGNYPFHLACTSGHTWESGLEALFRASPEVATCVCPLVLIANAATKTKARAHGDSWFRTKLTKAKKRASRQLGKKNIVPSPTELGALNTLFYVLRTDPNVALAFLRRDETDVSGPRKTS
jgi:hypothetical protein